MRTSCEINGENMKIDQAFVDRVRHRVVARLAEEALKGKYYTAIGFRDEFGGKKTELHLAVWKALQDLETDGVLVPGTTCGVLVLGGDYVK